MNKKILKKYSTSGLATKKDVKESENRLNQRIDRMQQYIDFKLKPAEDMSKDYQQFKNKVFDRFDWIISKLQKFEQEFIIQNEMISKF